MPVASRQAKLLFPPVAASNHVHDGTGCRGSTRSGGYPLWPFPRPAARALVERDGEYLFVAVEMDGGRRWILPGGGVEAGESPREAVAREVREETGLTVTVGDPVDAFAFESSLGPHVATVFRCTSPDGALTVGEHPDAEPIVEARWVPADEVGDLSLPAELAPVVERCC